MSRLREVITTISDLFLNKKDKNESEDSKVIKSLVVPCTSVLPFGIYEGIIERNGFASMVHLAEGDFRACNFIKPRQFNLKNGELKIGSTVTGYVGNNLKTLEILRLRKCNEKVVFLTPQIDAFFVNEDQ